MLPADESGWVSQVELLHDRRDKGMSRQRSLSKYHLTKAHRDSGSQGSPGSLYGPGTCFGVESLEPVRGKEDTRVRRNTARALNDCTVAVASLPDGLATLMVDAEEIREQHAWVARLMNWMTPSILPPRRMGTESMERVL